VVLHGHSVTEPQFTVKLRARRHPEMACRPRWRRSPTTRPRSSSAVARLTGEEEASRRCITPRDQGESGSPHLTSAGSRRACRSGRRSRISATARRPQAPGTQGSDAEPASRLCDAQAPALAILSFGVDHAASRGLAGVVELEPNEPRAPRERDQLGSGVHAELPHDVRDVGSHGRLGEMESFGEISFVVPPSVASRSRTSASPRCESPPDRPIRARTPPVERRRLPGPTRRPDDRADASGG
jgi:hypothetical protein